MDMFHFLTKPKVRSIAKKHIASINQNEFYEICFHAIPHRLYWPLQFDLQGINQITAETFDEQDWHFYQKQYTTIEQEEILLDIGSAEGLFPLTVVDKCKKIFLIEPNPYFYQSLQHTFAPFVEKVEIIHCAAGNSEGIIYLQGESLTGQISESVSGSAVAIHKVDSIIKSNQRISYLKADIEGFEQEMLEGAEQTIRRNKPKIAITTYHRSNQTQEIIRLVKSFVPEYQFYVMGLYHEECKPVMVHFWV